MKPPRWWLTLVVLLASAGASQAQTVPTKTITIYNNSAARTLFPVIQAPIQNGTGVHDLWLQAQFDVADVTIQVFNTTLLYKLFVNRRNGIPPKTSVTITLPFYTQLLPVSPGNLGRENDQFIDWWNAMRIYIFDGKDAVTAAYDYSVDSTGKVVPPLQIDPYAGAAVPTCASTSATCEPLPIEAYVNGFPTSVPAQLVEYTFAAAVGPPLDPKLGIDTGIVNYNISAVDSVYLPAAIGAHGNGTAKNTYLGSPEKVSVFREALNDFSGSGSLWPYFVPAYFAAANPTIPLKQPPAGGKPYPLPQLPSTNVVYAESYRSPTPAPPVLSSNTPAGMGNLGSVAQSTLDLWTHCTTSTSSSVTCKNIRDVATFFTDDYHQCFPGRGLPVTHDLLTTIYGWVQFPDCSTPLANAPGYTQAIQTYCNLQYNFFDPAVPASEVFNPYVALIHQTLASNAYAFSIDDAVSFKSLPGDGVVVTVAGTNGLENTTQNPLPTASTYQTYCRGG